MSLLKWKKTSINKEPSIAKLVRQPEDGSTIISASVYTHV